MKKPVTQFDLAAAFKALDEIDYGTVESNPVKNSKKLNESLLKETCKRISGRKLNIERLVEDYYDLDDEQDLNKAAADREAEIAQAKLSRIEKIVDLDAKTADDLLPSYVGKVIVRCPQCMNMFYKNEEDIVKDEEDPTICNVNEPCQHCGNISGYEIIGKVDKLSPEDTAKLTGDEETPAEGEEDLDLDVAEEEAPAEEDEATEEGAEEEVDLDLDLDLEEPAQESLNASKAAKSDFASKNETENKTLNESRAWKNDLEFCQMINDGKVKPNPYGLGYIRLGELSQLCVDNHLDYAHNVIEQAISKLTEKGDKYAEALTEANKYGRSDDEDYYAQDINDAVMQLKKTGHAEFWCRQGKAKADQVVKTFEDRYGKKAEYTIDDDYCTAKVVKEDLKEDTDPNHIKQITDYLNRVKNSFDKEFTDKEKMACHPDGNGLMQVVDIYIKKHPEDEGNNLGGDDAFLDLFDKILYDHVLNEVTKTAKVVKEDLHEDVASILNSFAASLDDDNFEAPIEDSVEESVNKAEADVNTIPENESENKSINEGDDNCEGCKKSTCKSKVKDNLDEAVAITISVDEIDDQVMANDPADTMIVAEPEATAIYDQPVYDQPEFPVVEVEPQEIENPFEQEFETPADFAGKSEEVDDEVEDEPVDEEEDEKVDESLQEGIFDSIKNKASQAKSAVKGKSVEDGFSKWKVVSTANNGKSTVKDFASYAEARNYAIAMSKQMSIKQALIKATDTTGVESAIDGYIKGKQALAAKKLFKKAQLAAQGAPALDNNLELDTSNPEPVSEPASEVKPEVKPEGMPTKDELTAALTAAGYKDPKTIQKIVNALAANNLVTEALNEDLNSATDKAVAKLQALNDQAMSTLNMPDGAEEPREELLADNANDAKDATGVETINDKYQSGGFGYETPNTEADETKVAENLQEDVSDTEYDQMLNSKVFQDFNEEINIDDIDEIDEESVNECTTNYLKEVYSNVDKFELTKADVTNGILVLEGLIKFHSGKTRNTTFGYNLATGKHLAFSGVNEDLAKNGKFNIQCSLNNKSLVVESLSYSHEVNGQLVEGLVHKN